MRMGSFVNIVVSLYFWLKSDSNDKLCAKTSKHYWTDVECNLGRKMFRMKLAGNSDTTHI